MFGANSGVQCYPIRVMSALVAAPKPFCLVWVFALEIPRYYENRTFLVITYFNQVNISMNQLNFSFLSPDLFLN